MGVDNYLKKKKKKRIKIDSTVGSDDEIRIIQRGFNGVKLRQTYLNVDSRTQALKVETLKQH